MRKTLSAVAMSFLLACTSTTTISSEIPTPEAKPAVRKNFIWKQLTTEAYRGKQDDIFFIDERTGWYVNGSGRIYKTTDGGETWTLKLNKPGTYFRCIAFVDQNRGFAGNIGTEYFPNVTDETPLYETRDGGETWTAVTNITGPAVKGLCAIWVNRFSYVNAGVLDYKTHIYAAGRVGGPAFLLKSTDGGETWTSSDLSQYTAIITDVMMFDEFNGVICGSSDRNTATSNARIITTSDGGKTWTTRYQSTRLFEITWKVSFPTRKTGYVTLQNYNPDRTVSQRYVAKSTDGGATWSELPVTDDHAFREFGIAFLDEQTGWIGGSNTGFETRDGGATWQPVNLGKATNKIRLVGDTGYAIGVDVYKLAME